MTPKTRDNSSFLHPPLAYAPLIVAVGGDEPKGWRQMSEDFFKLCKKRALKCDYLEVPGANHYSISAHLADPTSPLTRAMLR